MWRTWRQMWHAQHAAGPRRPLCAGSSSSSTPCAPAAAAELHPVAAAACTVQQAQHGSAAIAGAQKEARCARAAASHHHHITPRLVSLCLGRWPCVCVRFHCRAAQHMPLAHHSEVPLALRSSRVVWRVGAQHEWLAALAGALCGRGDSFLRQLSRTVTGHACLRAAERARLHHRLHVRVQCDTGCLL